MIGCTTMERHIVSSSMKSPLERINNPASPQFIAVKSNSIEEIDPRCQFLYVDISQGEYVSEEVWMAIKYQLHKHAHAILYSLDFKADSRSVISAAYQEIALYPLSHIEVRTPTYASFSWLPDGYNGHIEVSTYSVRPVQTSGA